MSFDGLQSTGARAWNLLWTAPGGGRRRFGKMFAWVGVTALLSAVAITAFMIDTRSETATGRTVDQQAISYVREQLRAQGGPTSAFAVVRNGTITASDAMGEGVGIDTPFLLGSLSKSFTALAVMQLVDTRRVELDQPVTSYIPWFRTADPTAVITVRQLLDQTSGLPTWAGTVDLSEPDTTLEQRVRAVADVTPISTPGAEFHYCNKNYAILGALVEEVTGLSYAEYLQENILDPLDMGNTFTSVSDARDEGLVDGSSIWFGWHVRQSPVAFPGALPDGNLVSTVSDLSHYVEAQQSGTYAGRRIISEASLSQMHSGQIADDAGSLYAFGWRESTIRGQRVIQHEGDLSNFHSNLGMMPRTGSALVVLTAHNSQLVDTSIAYDGGMHILTGGPVPEVDNSYRTAGAATSILAIVEAALLAAGTINLATRIRRTPSDPRPWRRRVGAPALGYLAASIGGTTLIYVGVKSALRQEVQVTPTLLLAALPDVSTMMAVAMGWLGLAGVITLIAGTARSRATHI